jgi:hypothetical protein
VGSSVFWYKNNKLIWGKVTNNETSNIYHK